ncbi:MAG: hypothetical protein ACREEI_12595 [Stellaceae bacterium]
MMTKTLIRGLVLGALALAVSGCYYGPPPSYGYYGSGYYGGYPSYPAYPSYGYYGPPSVSFGYYGGGGWGGGWHHHDWH